jgi:hypothetical protein
VGLWLKLSKFDYVIKYCPGITNPADKLSRRADYMTEEPLPTTPFLNLSTTDIFESEMSLLNLSTTVVLEMIRTRYREVLNGNDKIKKLIFAEILPEE